MEPALALSDLEVFLSLGKFKDKKKILKGISLKVKKGMIFGFLGPNGSGKTTTIKAILGLIPQFSGKIEIFGEDSRKAGVKKKIGYAPENASFNEFLTPREILHSLGSLSLMNKSEITAKSVELLRYLGIEEVMDVPVFRFSKGMKQRVNLVQAMLHEPLLLILDEPASGLDPIGKAEVKNLLLSLKKRNVTVFVSSHHLLDAQEFCDEIAILREGGVLCQGSPQQFCKQRNLEQFFVSMVKGEKQ